MLLWHYHDDDIRGPEADVSLSVGLIDGQALKTCRQHRVDEAHGNPFMTWLAMGSPKQPSDDQIKQLKAVAAATEAETPTLTAGQDSVRLKVRLPRQSVVLLELTP